MEKGCPQIPHANKRYVRRFILIKRLSEKGQQIIDIVAVSFFPERAEVREIPSDGRGIDFDGIAQLSGRYTLFPGCMKVF